MTQAEKFCRVVSASLSTSKNWMEVANYNGIKRLIDSNTLEVIGVKLIEDLGLQILIKSDCEFFKSFEYGIYLNEETDPGITSIIEDDFNIGKIKEDNSNEELELYKDMTIDIFNYYQLKPFSTDPNLVLGFKSNIAPVVEYTDDDGNTKTAFAISGDTIIIDQNIFGKTRKSISDFDNNDNFLEFYNDDVLVMKTTSIGNGITTYFKYDKDGNILSTVLVRGNEIVNYFEYIYENGKKLKKIYHDADMDVEVSTYQFNEELNQRRETIEFNNYNVINYKDLTTNRVVETQIDPDSDDPTIIITKYTDIDDFSFKVETIVNDVLKNISLHKKFFGLDVSISSTNYDEDIEYIGMVSNVKETENSVIITRYNII